MKTRLSTNNFTETVLNALANGDGILALSTETVPKFTGVVIPEGQTAYPKSLVPEGSRHRTDMLELQKHGIENQPK